MLPDLDARPPAGAFRGPVVTALAPNCSLRHLYSYAVLPAARFARKIRVSRKIRWIPVHQNYRGTRNFQDLYGGLAGFGNSLGKACGSDDLGLACEQGVEVGGPWW